MIPTTSGNGPTRGRGYGRAGLPRGDRGEYRCEVAYDLGERPTEEQEWWLLKITSWLVERGSVCDVEFVRSEAENVVRVEFGFATVTDCRRFQNRGSHRLVVDGERVLDSRFESRCDLPE